MHTSPADENTCLKSDDKKLLLSSECPTAVDQGNIQHAYGSVEEKDDLLPPDDPCDKKWVKAITYLRSLTTEPVMFLFMFAFMMNASTFSNLLMDKGCRYRLNFTEEVCSNLSAHEKEKDTVEILAANYSLYYQLCGLVGAAAMLFIAPWSDKYSRKTPLFMAIGAVILTDIGIILCTYNFESDLSYLILARIPSELSGGFICMLTILYSHASEVTSEDGRTIKYMTLEIGLISGMSLGGLAGGLMLRDYGYLYVQTTGFLLHVLCLPWIALVVEETKTPPEGATWRHKVKDIFKCENLMTGCKVTVRKRENNGRMLMLLFFASMCVIVLMYESFAGINFIYVHHLYNWDPADYNKVNTTFQLTQLLIILIVTPLLSKMYRVSDYALGLIGVVSMMAKNAGIAFSHLGPWMFYLGNAFGYLNSLSPLAVRSGISKLSDMDELGRVFSFLSTCEAVLPLAGSIIITKVFNSTLDIKPSISYLMTVGFLLLPLGTFTYAYISTKRNQQQLQSDLKKKSPA